MQNLKRRLMEPTDINMLIMQAEDIISCAALCEEDLSAVRWSLQRDIPVAEPVPRRRPPVAHAAVAASAPVTTAVGLPQDNPSLVVNDLCPSPSLGSLAESPAESSSLDSSADLSPIVAAATAGTQNSATGQRRSFGNASFISDFSIAGAESAAAAPPGHRSVSRRIVSVLPRRRNKPAVPVPPSNLVRMSMYNDPSDDGDDVIIRGTLDDSPAGATKTARGKSVSINNSLATDLTSPTQQTAFDYSSETEAEDEENGDALAGSGPDSNGALFRLWEPGSFLRPSDAFGAAAAGRTA